jgi:hypothetical protein
MPHYPGNMGPTRAASKDGKTDVTFTPNRGDKVREVTLGEGYVPNRGYAPNAVEEIEGGNIWSARIIVGLSVGQASRYTIDDVIQLVRIKRLEQGKPPDSSFLAMRGVYTGKVGGELVTEDSVQVLLVDIWGTPQAKFRQEMIDLAEYLREQMRQELVILDLQQSGVTQKQYLVFP